MRFRFIPTLLFVGAAASQLGSTDCGGDVLRDPGFDLWCGDSLCAWKVERGEIQDVPTWHAGDHGVELVGSDVAIEQVSPIASTDGTCIEFDLIANVAGDASAVLNVDVFDDGTIDLAEHLPTGTWQPLTFQLRMPDTYAGVRFEIAKTGTGTAELANIGATVVTDGCDGQPALVVDARPLGVPCDTADQCASGICGQPPVLAPFGGVPTCVACDADHACTGGDVCGLDDPVSPLRGPPVQCEPPASRDLGQQCTVDDECTTGRCNGDMCSTCDSGSDCGPNEACSAAWTTDAWLEIAAFECAPGAQHRASGEPCVTDGDCISGECDGAALSTCWDGRSCATDADCPFSGLQNTACTPVGVQGGSCH